MAQILGTLAKWAIPVGLAVGGAQTAMYDGNIVDLHYGLNDLFS